MSGKFKRRDYRGLKHTCFSEKCLVHQPIRKSPVLKLALQQLTLPVIKYLSFATPCIKDKILVPLGNSMRNPIIEERSGPRVGFNIPGQG